MCLLSGTSFKWQHFINCSGYTASNENVVAKADHILSHSMERSPSWEANRFSARQEIPCIYGNLRFITAFTSARHLSLSWARSIQSLPPPTHLLKIHFKIILPFTRGSSKWSLSLRFPHQNPVCTSPRCVLHAPRISSIWSPE